MKKIILLLTVLTLGVIACDKNELGDMDSMSINPIEATIEADPMSNIDIDGFISRLSDHMSSDKGSPNTSKTATAGTSYISIYTGVIGGNLYEIAFPDGSTHCAPEASGLTHLTLFYASNGDSELYLGEVSDNILLVTITVDLSFLYAEDLVDYGIKVNGSDFAVTNASVSNSVYTF